MDTDTWKAAIAAGQQYDLDHKPWGNWSRVSDQQAARLLTGAIEYLWSVKALPREGCNDAAGSEVAQVRKEQ